MALRTPYLMFVGDAADQLAAKTAQGVVHWRPEWCVGQLRLDGCNADLGIPDMTLEEAAEAGVKTLIVGVANRGGIISDAWAATLVRAIDLGMDIASGLHNKLGDIPAVLAAAEACGRDLYDVRHPTKPFTISRGTKTTAEVVVVELADNEGTRGWAECVPYPRYDETIDGVMAQINDRARELENGMTNASLHESMPSGAARNALDCALWDIAAKQAGKRAWELIGLAEPEPTITAETLSIGDADEMGDAARALKDAPLIKAKLNRDMIITRMAAVRDAAPSARLIIDPNESWDMDTLRDVAKPLADLGVEMIEQPLPAHDDHVLADYDCPVDLCADESCHTVDTLPALKSRYDMINIKLDKTGGLTEAVQLAQAAHDLGFGIMVGCMVGTSLAMAPATLLAPFARFVDLDGPLLMKEDRENGLTFENGCVCPPTPALWG